MHGSRAITGNSEVQAPRPYILEAVKDALPSLCRARKKLNYAELCEADSEEEEEDQEIAEQEVAKQARDPGASEAVQSPRERKRPKSAPNSFMQQPLRSPDADRQAKLKQALILQMEMQKRLHDQLEVQSNPLH